VKQCFRPQGLARRNAKTGLLWRWELRITDILWKEAVIEKLADKHRVSIYEVEEALRSAPLIRRVGKGRVRGEDVYSARAQIGGGRYLIVFFILKVHGIIMPVSARDMNPAERKRYAKER